MDTITDEDACAVIEGYDGLEHAKEDIYTAFQHLINSGVVWQLPGFYGRTADRLVKAGICHV